MLAHSCGEVSAGFTNITSITTCTRKFIDHTRAKPYRDSIFHNVTKGVKEFVKTHEKKHKNFRKNSVLPFKSDEVVTNLSSVSLNTDQLNVLKYGLTHSICTPSINKTDIFACFELISQRMLKNLKESNDTGKLATELSWLTRTCHHIDPRPRI